MAMTAMLDVDRSIKVLNLAPHRLMGSLAQNLYIMGKGRTACAPGLTDEVAIGLFLSQSMYNLHTAAVAEQQRISANEAMAAAFDDVDFVIAATNPGRAFAADSPMSNPSASFIDSAKANRFARMGFLGVLGGVRVA